ncbi:hypothetical protein FOCC_FOCC014636 [Frankliniella occidentalis]|nr:hypothetical protein FOCC_FOCC014636 [Frankliniella occidentalis]
MSSDRIKSRNDLDNDALGGDSLQKSDAPPLPPSPPLPPHSPSILHRACAVLPRWWFLNLRAETTSSFLSRFFFFFVNFIVSVSSITLSLRLSPARRRCPSRGAPSSGTSPRAARPPTTASATSSTRASRSTSGTRSPSAARAAATWSPRATRPCRASSAGSCGGGTEATRPASTGWVRSETPRTATTGSGSTAATWRCRSGTCPAATRTARGTTAPRAGSGQTPTARPASTTSASTSPRRVASPSSHPTPPWWPAASTWAPPSSTRATRATCWWGRPPGRACPPASTTSSRPCARVSIQCGFPADISHGSYRLLNGTVSYLSRVLYSCQDGFRMLGRALLTCDIDERWNGPPPKCQAIECEEPTAIPNGRAVLKTNSTRVGSVVEYGCSTRGYKLLGPKTITCLPTGQWSQDPPVCKGEWSGAAPRPTTSADEDVQVTVVVPFAEDVKPAPVGPSGKLPARTSPATPRTPPSTTATHAPAPPPPTRPATAPPPPFLRPRPVPFSPPPPKPAAAPKPPQPEEEEEEEVEEEVLEEEVNELQELGRPAGSDSQASGAAHVPRIVVASNQPPQPSDTPEGSNSRAGHSPGADLPGAVDAEKRDTLGAKLNLGAIIALGVFGGFVFLAAMITTIVILIRSYSKPIFNGKVTRSASCPPRAACPRAGTRCWRCPSPTSRSGGGSSPASTTVGPAISRTRSDGTEYGVGKHSIPCDLRNVTGSPLLAPARRPASTEHGASKPSDTPSIVGMDWGWTHTNGCTLHEHEVWMPLPRSSHLLVYIYRESKKYKIRNLPPVPPPMFPENSTDPFCRSDVTRCESELTPLRCTNRSREYATYPFTPNPKHSGAGGPACTLGCTPSPRWR